MSRYEVVIKQIEEKKVASKRGVVPNPPAQRTLWDELMKQLADQGAQIIDTPFAIYHDSEFKEKDWDIEVCAPIADGVNPSEGITIYNLPGVKTMACVVHAGSFSTILQAYEALAKWIDENGFKISGSARELTLEMPAVPGDQEDPGTVVEIQYPVEKSK